jgi:pyruvate kinase
MYKEPNPNRNESADIGYSVLDGIDGVVLNTTTSEGAYPDLCVSAISRTITEAEKTIDYKQCFANLKKYGHIK